MAEIRAKIEGMDCVTCAKSIEKGVSALGYSCQVDFVNAELIIKEDSIDKNKVKERIKQLGYKVYFSEDEVKKDKTHLAKIIISLVFTVPMWIGMILPFNIFHNPYFQWLLATPASLIGIFHFGRGAINSIKVWNPNMDTLVFLGGTLAYFYSVYEVLIGKNYDYIFFETAASIFTIILIGTYIEHYSISKTRKELEELEKLATVYAYKLGEAGKFVKVRSEELNVGDIIRVATGDNVPVDCEITEGNVLVNESLITGESRPVNKSTGNELYSGSVVIEGNAICKVIRNVSDSMLSKIIKLSKEAGSKRADVQKLADRISAVFVPVIIVIALLTFLGNYFIFSVPFVQSISRAIAVLVIACPCALGIATPVAVVVGVGRSAKYGILIKDSNAFEKVSKANYFLLDKTGTLTKGEFSIIEEHFLADWDKEEIYSLIYSIEQFSQHPIAKFFVNKFQGIPVVKLDNIKEIKGKGLIAKYGDYEVKFGKFSPESYIVLMLNDKVIYKVKLGDEIKENAKDFINLLKKYSIEPVLVSGDLKSSCESVAKELGIKTVYSEVSPEDKLKIVSDYVKKGIVVMVGDGINDAPALAKAHVGVAVGKENALSIAYASVVMLNTNIKTFIKLLTICRKVYLNIKQNLFWAFIYNVLAVPFAVFGYVKPIIGAITMALSDVIVVFNALLMRSRL